MREIVDSYYWADLAEQIEDMEDAEYVAVHDLDDSLYSIRKTLVRDSNNNYIVCYGVFNNETGVRETEVRQLGVAVSCVNALTESLREPTEEEAREFLEAVAQRLAMDDDEGGGGLH